MMIIVSLLATGLFAFNLWLCCRPNPGPGERFFGRLGLLTSGAMIIGTMPIWLWPQETGTRVTASILSLVLAVIAIVFSVRRIRMARKSVGPASF
jgi:hypothetical protein